MKEFLSDSAEVEGLMVEKLAVISVSLGVLFSSRTETSYEFLGSDMKETASDLPFHGVISCDLLVFGQLLAFCKTTSKSKAAENRTAMKDNL